MPLSAAARAVEAVLIVAVEPVPPGLLAELLELPVDQIDPIVDELIDSCHQGERGFEVVRIAGGLRIQTHPDLAAYVERFANVGVSSRLSAAALETLASQRNSSLYPIMHRSARRKGRCSMKVGARSHYSLDALADVKYERRTEAPETPVLKALLGCGVSHTHS